MSAPLNEKRLLAVLDKAGGRYRWYARTYLPKSVAHPKEPSKRWWDALSRACARYDFSAEEVWERLLAHEGFIVPLSMGEPYREHFNKRYGAKCKPGGGAELLGVLALIKE